MWPLAQHQVCINNAISPRLCPKNSSLVQLMQLAQAYPTIRGCLVYMLSGVSINTSNPRPVSTVVLMIVFTL